MIAGATTTLHRSPMFPPRLCRSAAFSLDPVSTPIRTITIARLWRSKLLGKLAAWDGRDMMDVHENRIDPSFVCMVATTVPQRENSRSRLAGDATGGTF